MHVGVEDDHSHAGISEDFGHNLWVENNSEEHQVDYILLLTDDDIPGASPPS